MLGVHSGLVLDMIVAVLANRTSTKRAGRIWSYLLICNLFTIITIAQEPIVIDWDKANVQEIKMSSLFKSVNYIPLELTKDCLIDGNYRVYTNSDYILTLGSFQNIFMFDRKSGKFIKEVSHIGNGPNEYRMLVLGYNFCPSQDVVFVDDFKKWKGINVRTNKIAIEVTRPSERYKETNENSGKINNPYWIDFQKGLFWGYTNNTTGSYPDMLVLFDKNGNIKKKFPNHNKYNPKQGGDSPFNSGVFYEYNQSLYFTVHKVNEPCDTVYHVTTENITPHIIFKFNNNTSNIEYKSIDGSKQMVYQDYKAGTVSCVDVFETDHRIFFKCYVQKEGVTYGYYDKKEKTLFRTPAGDKGGFTNDIDGLTLFKPTYHNKSSWIGAIDPDLLLEQYKSKRLTQLSPKGKKLIEGIQFDDNPIIVIPTLR